VAITNTDLIADSLRELGVINEIQAPSAEQAAFALRKLNQIMAQLDLDDLNFQYFPQATGDLGNNCPIPAAAELAITYMLAIAQASNYGKTVSQELGTMAANAWETVMSAIVAQQLPQATVVNRPNGAGWSRRHSRILTG